MVYADAMYFSPFNHRNGSVHYRDYAIYEVGGNIGTWNGASLLRG